MKVSRGILGFLGTVGLAVGSMAVAAPHANAATQYLNCAGISPTEGYEPCTGDNFSVGSGKKVYITNTTSSKGVNFKLYNHNGHHLLAPGPLQAPGNKSFIWTNDTSSSIVVEVEADPNSSSTVDVSGTVSY